MTAFLSGMNGTTSTAPIRGCTPCCSRMSITSSALSQAAAAPLSMSSGAPMKVNTVRLWSLSVQMSRSRTPLDFLQGGSAIASILFLSFPSLKFGTHSRIFIHPHPSRPLPSRERELNLKFGTHSRIFMARPYRLVLLMAGQKGPDAKRPTYRGAMCTSGVV